MKKFILGSLFLLLLLAIADYGLRHRVGTSCPAYTKNLHKFTGDIGAGKRLDVIYAFPLGESGASPYDLITTELAVPGQGQQQGHPRLHYIRYQGEGRFVEDKNFPQVLTEHAREVLPLTLHGQKAFVVADHGFDWPPYRGGHPHILVNEKGRWKDRTKKLFPDQRSFNFNVSAFSLNHDGNLDLFFSVVNSAKQFSFLLKNNGHDYFFPANSLPRELQSYESCYMTSRFWGEAEGSDYVFLGGCDRPPEAPKTVRDRILRIENGKTSLLPEDSVSARKKDPSWGTVDLRVADLNKDGARDVIAAVHNFGFTEGGIQLYFKKPGAMSFQTPEDGYLPVTDKDTPSFVPFVHLGDLDGDGYPEIVAPIAPTTVKGVSPQLRKFFALYQNEKGQGFADISMCLVSSLNSVAYADMMDLDQNGKPDIFLLGYDGRYEIYYNQSELP